MTHDLEQQHGVMTEAGTVADIARQVGTPQEILSDVHSVLVPAGDKLELLDLERYSPEPERKRGERILHEHVSFADYVTGHTLPGTHVYADVRTSTITAVLNDHDPQDAEGNVLPGWGDHRARLDLRHSHEWDTWVSADGCMIDQTKFAEHLEDNYLDIVDPDHATMLEIAQSIEATSSGQFESKQRLTDGQVALRYTEQVSASAGQKGDLTIPETFKIALRVYEGLDPVELTARLRYRIRNGQLAIGYKLERLDDVKDKAFSDVVDAIEQRLGRQLLRGAAPSPVTPGR